MPLERTYTISPVALRQLAEWEKLAKDWPVYTSEAGFIRCAHCDLAVWRTHDNHGQEYALSEREILALRVGHLRNHHPSLDPCEDIV
jgi:hypothetical protein